MFKVGSGSLQYELVEGWEQIPSGFKHADVAGVCTDSRGNVYLLCRGDHPVMVYDRDGRFLHAWGEGQFSYRTHGMYMGKDDFVYLVDDSNHSVGKYTLDGKHLFNLGPSETPSDTGGYDGRTPASVTRAAGPFNRPTNLAVAPNGDLFVSDGYGNTRIHRFTTEGRLCESWGEGQFSYRTHGMYMGKDDFVYLVDDSNHSVGKYTLDGKHLFNLGPSETPSDTGGYDGRTPATVTRAAGPFNRPTNLAVAPSGDLFVSDGYGNTRIHRFTADGRLCESWGEPGSGPGQFRVPHSTWVHTDGRVFVCDRENDRIQIFSPEGKYLTEWLDVQRPQDIFIDTDERVYVGELVWRAGLRSFRRGPIEVEEPARLSIFDIQGHVLLRWGGADAAQPGNFVAPHGIWVDDRGAIYMAEVTDTIGVKPGIVPEGTHTFQKFARV